MMLWRISRHSTLDGHGGLLASARWHSQGRSIVYLAESPAGALLESLVHLELTPDAYPAHYGLLKAEASDEISVRTLGPGDLSGDWVGNVILTRTIGDEWLASQSTVLLRVPSAIVPETFNVLLNPEHPEAGRVQVLWHAEYPWDARLLN
jgi:RES domain-containing protein